MRAASVGQQCVECIRESNNGVRPAQNVFGGRAPAAGSRRLGLPGAGDGATVTWALVAINVLLFLVELAKPSLGTDWGMLGYASYSQGGAMHGVAAGEWYRLISSAFLPPPVTGSGGLGGLGFMDILFNMWALVFVGPALERLVGAVRFAGIYLLSALGGAVMLYYIAPQNELALGASGAIFGLFGAWFVVARRLRLDTRGIVGLIVINLVFSFVFRSYIAWQDHLGGLITGALITAAYAYAPRERRAALQLAATVAVIALAIVAVMIRTHQLTS
jgi:membrane associated rhomboid family serine protease